MPLRHQDIQGPRDKMFIVNANPRHPHRHHEFFLRNRPYRGEPPTVAGFLLYPDTPAKMETTSREAFCFRPIPQDRGKGLQPYLQLEIEHTVQSAQQESHCSHPTSSRQTGRGNSSSKDKEPREDEQQKRNNDQAVLTTPRNLHDVTDMQSQYQTDFPPPSSCRRRRTPAFPQADNIGINPAFRIEFNTVQRENYPGWPIMTPRYAGKLRAASPGQTNMTFAR